MAWYNRLSGGETMRINWIGHACFLIQENDISVLTDPFDESVNYPFPKLSVDVVTESHQHFDHNAHKRLINEPTVFKVPGVYETHGLTIKGVPTFHDADMGKERGDNCIFRIDFPSKLSVSHLGDLGHMLNSFHKQQLGSCDILMVPVGGTYTIDSKTAKEVVDLLQPSIVIPMHFKTPWIQFPIKPVDEFLSLLNWPVTQVQDLEVSKDRLADVSGQCFVFSPKEIQEESKTGK